MTLTDRLEAIKTQPFRRIYLVWGIVLIIGFLLSGYGVGEGYWYWFPLVLIGLVGQGYRALQGWQTKLLFAAWAGLAWVGTYATMLEFKGVIPFSTIFPHIGMAWLLSLGVMQVVTGLAVRQRIEWLLGVTWIIIALALRTTDMLPLPSFALIAAVTGIPYLYFAFKK
jgi:hypothetical protein